MVCGEPCRVFLKFPIVWDVVLPRTSANRCRCFGRTCSLHILGRRAPVLSETFIRVFETNHTASHPKTQPCSQTKSWVTQMYCWPTCDEADTHNLCRRYTRTRRKQLCVSHYLFIYGLFSEAVSSSVYIASNGRTNYKHVEGGSCSLVWGTTWEFAWRKWEKSRKILDQDSWTPSRNLNWVFPNTKQEC